MTEYRRVFGALQDSDEPPAIPPRTMAVTSAFMTFFVCVLYIPSAVYLDGWLRSNPYVVKTLHQSQEVMTIETVELIGQDYYKPGTVGQIEQAYLGSINELELSINELREVSENSFQLMAENVDDYLGWYYSLTAEYEHIVALASGALKEWMTENLQAYLMKGNAFGPVQESIETAFNKNKQLKAEYMKKVEHILSENHFCQTSVSPPA